MMGEFALDFLIHVSYLLHVQKLLATGHRFKLHFADILRFEQNMTKGFLFSDIKQKLGPKSEI